MSFLKWAAITLAVIFVTLVAMAGVIWTNAKSAGAPYEGDYALDGLSGPARIVRDEKAVPHIEAATPEDAYFALGFAHAQDRLWQMDLTRRQSQGRIAEIFGEIALSTDVSYRMADFAENVERTWAALAPQDKRQIEAYAAGVNAWIAHPDFRLPAEYQLTFSKPEPWLPTDSLFAQKALWTTLSLNLSRERLRRRLANIGSEEIQSAFFEAYPDDGHVAMAWPDLARTLGLPLDDAANAAPEEANAPNTIHSDPARENSNNWVVSGARTKSGAPMLANDPHLLVTMPGFWYLAHLKIGETNVRGGTIPGIPGVIVGRNDSLSWGATNNTTDVQDGYIESLNPDDPNQYATPDGWAEFETREETFKVRFGKDVTRTMRRTRHGPVLPADAMAPHLIDENKEALALRWTSLDGPDTTISTMMNTYAVDTVDEFVEILRNGYIGPVQNLVFAHKDGATGLMVIGRAPARSPEHETSGIYSADGSKPENDWTGYIPTALTPLVVNPTSGALVTANAKTTPDEYPYFRSVDYANPSRQQRIQDLIDATPRHDFESFRAIHMDLGTTNVEGLKALMLRAKTDDPDALKAMQIVRDWDGRWTADALGPLVYATWAKEFADAAYAEDLGDLTQWYMSYDADLLTGVLKRRNDALCDNRETAEPETCDDILSASLEAAAASLKEAHGATLSRPWGEVYETRLDHLGLAPIPLIGPALSRTAPREAGPDAPNVGYFSYKDLPKSASGAQAPSLRMIFDMSDPDASWFSLPNGQSGHFASPHYDDLLKGWITGEYITIGTDIDAIADPRTITLRPAAN